MCSTRIPPSPPSGKSSGPTATGVRVLIFTSARRKQAKTCTFHMLMNFSTQFDTNISPVHDIKVVVNGIL